MVGLPFLERDPVPELRIKQAATPVARIGFGMWTSLAVVFRAREYKLLFNSQVSTLNVQRSTLEAGQVSTFTVRSGVIDLGWAFSVET